MKSIAITVFCSLMFLGCTKYIEFDAEDKKSKIVINGVVVSNQTAKVHVSRSLSVLDEGDLNIIDDAVVQLFDENNTLIENLLPVVSSLPPSSNDGLYAGTVLLDEDTEYNLKVSASSFESVTAKTRIPRHGLTQLAPIDSGAVNSNEEYIDPRTFFTFQFSDNGNETNYYGIEAYGISNTGDQYQIGDLFTENVSVDNQLGNEILFSDKFFNGGSYDLTIDFSIINYSYFNPNPGEVIQYDSVEFVFNSYSRDLYLYKKSYNEYQNTDEFFSQPVQVYSNIDQGLGVFGGIKVDSFTIKIE